MTSKFVVFVACTRKSMTFKIVKNHMGFFLLFDTLDFKFQRKIIKFWLLEVSEAILEDPVANLAQHTGILSSHGGIVRQHGANWSQHDST